MGHTPPAEHCAGGEDMAQTRQALPSWSLQSYGGDRHKANNSQTIGAMTEKQAGKNSPQFRSTPDSRGGLGWWAGAPHDSSFEAP